ncbi:MAG: hypothetical protein ABSD99_07270 [Candidatus Bathyarchaeia archaeon]
MPENIEKLTLKKLDQILEKLDRILRVLGVQVAYGGSVTERARLLKIAGVDNQTIAEILNTSPATIRTLTTHLRRE